MEPKILIAAVLAVLVFSVIGFVAVISSNASVSAPTLSSAAPSQNSTTNVFASTQSSKILFADSPYYSYSYLISSTPLSQQAKTALTGFNLTTSSFSNGSENITISLDGTSSSKTIMLPSGYKLYIIESSYGDDGFGRDSFLGDDQFVEVDSNGYVVN